MLDGGKLMVEAWCMLCGGIEGEVSNLNQKAGAMTIHTLTPTVDQSFPYSVCLKHPSGARTLQTPTMPQLTQGSDSQSRTPHVMAPPSYARLIVCHTEFGLDTKSCQKFRN